MSQIIIYMVNRKSKKNFIKQIIFFFYIDKNESVEILIHSLNKTPSYSSFSFKNKKVIHRKIFWV